MPVYDAHNGDRGLVIINGVIIGNCVSVDEEKGEALIALVNPNGSFMRNDFGEVVTVVVSGTVSFIPTTKDEND